MDNPDDKRKSPDDNTGTFCDTLNSEAPKLTSR